MSTVKKATKREVLVAISELIGAKSGISEINNKGITVNEATEVLTGMISQLDHKAEQAKKRAAKKKAEGDELRDIVEGVLTNEPQIIDAITAQVDFEGATKAKITARLTQLVNAEIATKEQVKTEDGRKVMAYKLAGAVEDVDTDTDSDDAEPVE